MSKTGRSKQKKKEYLAKALRILYLRLLISVKEAKTLQRESRLPPQCCSPKSVTPSLPLPRSHLLPTWLSSPGSKDDLLTHFPHHRLGNHKVPGGMSETPRFLPAALFLSLPYFPAAAGASHHRAVSLEFTTPGAVPAMVGIEAWQHFCDS